ncbi:hypothetical protein NS274_14450 [Pseudomonas oryzihabitans]|uniref:hypothetical protein n=1 Tax=Pseudomonas rhizoryzae TaxID=2571129 RepID=UPI0007372C26|nr:hypothetical protein [Pseudomonas rhizoryzae]APQ13737.1 hypothetical protein BJP27_20400 [Pseudomonas psychrotolerans]KTS76769.1 hypothetical protein NS274_14450 [Pseudomonas psychrotolerans]KTT00092.1 hypothetical protein NS376_15895 [Pseudomonas psychrotolerans]KTT14222.1 hypothetical protein NS2R_00835 [Pseudomonas psychrotolerans]KTT25036.1 hypothetical protein SB14R_08280 [Pseudomonas psychrotolerans]
MNLRNLPRLTKIGLIFFILGLLGVAFALYGLYQGPRPTEPGTIRSLVFAVGVQLTGYVLLNRNRFRFMSGRRKD